jgi:hypothetical protein
MADDKSILSTLNFALDTELELTHFVLTCETLTDPMARDTSLGGPAPWVWLLGRMMDRHREALHALESEVRTLAARQSP